MPVLHIENRPLWVVIYIVLITLLWPLSVLMVSIPLGQFAFFREYLLRIGTRIGIATQAASGSITRIAIFASGTGTNAARIIAYSKEKDRGFAVALIVCNKPGAGVLEVAARNSIPVLLVEKEIFFRGDGYVNALKATGIELVVLAGFLWKLPAKLVSAFPNRIINIHPALLPGYGGKGMYGHFVHEAVIASGDPESGITIHWVDELYDNGSIILQAKCPVVKGDTAETLAARIHVLEHRHYPEVVEQVVAGLSVGK